MLLPKEKLAGLDPAFVDTLTKISNKLPFTLWITEAVPAAQGSHVKESEHFEGLGVDVRVEGGYQRLMIVKTALEQGVNRIGAYDRHVHIGVSKTLPQPVLWVGKSS